MEGKDPGRSSIGFSIVLAIVATGGVLTGIVSLFYAIFSFDKHEYGVVGPCMIAAALAFGLLVIGFSRRA